MKRIDNSLFLELSKGFHGRKNCVKFFHGSKCSPAFIIIIPLTESVTILLLLILILKTIIGITLRLGWWLLTKWGWRNWRFPLQIPMWPFLMHGHAISHRAIFCRNVLHHDKYDRKGEIIRWIGWRVHVIEKYAVTILRLETSGGNAVDIRDKYLRLIETFGWIWNCICRWRIFDKRSKFLFE